MALKTIIINQEKCKQDDLCSKICNLIQRNKPDGYPFLREGGEDLCMSCGQCVAICPSGALEHSNVVLDNCPSINKELIINEQQAVQFLRSRRSRRAYKSKPIAQNLIHKLIRIASYAPSGGNTQKVEWTVFTEKPQLEKFTGLTMDWLDYEIRENPSGNTASYGFNHDILKNWKFESVDEVLWNAPVLIIASAQKDTDCGMIDLTLALSYLDLVAPTLGLGTCWVGTFTEAIAGWEPLKKEINLPEDHFYYYSMVLGYPKYKFQRLIERKKPVISWRT
jgi:nitroreductase/NAD-dependent dihydropyrimidine dehydrogenase PreA subunit